MEEECVEECVEEECVEEECVEEHEDKDKIKSTLL